MDLYEIPHPDNFSFVERVEMRGKILRTQAPSETLRCQIEDLGEDVFCLSLAAPGWKRREGLLSLHREFHPGGGYSLSLGKKGDLCLVEKAASRSREVAPTTELRRRRAPRTVLWGRPGRAVGKNGPAWMFRFDLEQSDRFFGMGEKWGPLEKHGTRSQFYNTDVWAAHPGDKVWFADVSSPYASIPYVILERRGCFMGLLIDSGYRAFVDLGSRLSMGGAVGGETQSAEEFFLGAVDGKPVLYVVVATTLRELTKKLQRLVGTTPRPPLWALGHQQSRWGYASTKDLLDLDREFSAHDIPNHGLWLDIDYMQDFGVFSTRKGAFDAASLRALSAKRRPIVPIIDPGVKVQPGSEVYESGLSGGHFCLAPSGRPYTGVVWPGKTHFPDFSQDKTRRWWAGLVAAFKGSRFAGFWLDMNDPATGPIENDSMLFSQGQRAHATFHNQYALGMAMATHAGLLEADPQARPFLLTRSGSTGIQRFAAVWTGDNFSNFHHLARTIPISVNLALSGVPFNGADVPGFGGDASDELAELYYQATFLFPFFRNHAVHGCRPQEPWAFGARTTSILRRYIRLRYRLLPYLYQLFIAHEKTGEPILGPLFLDTPSESPPREDQYMIGAALMFAPQLDQKAGRDVWLPPGHWYDLRDGAWTKGGRSVRMAAVRGQTSMYAHSGSIVPLAKERQLCPTDGGAPQEQCLLGDLEIHVFLRSGESAQLNYVVDDGRTRAYLKGEESMITIRCGRRGDRFVLDYRLVHRAESFLGLSFCVVLHGAPRGSSLRVGAEKVRLSTASLRLTGGRLEVLRTNTRRPFVLL